MRLTHVTYIHHSGNLGGTICPSHYYVLKMKERMSGICKFLPTRIVSPIDITIWTRSDHARTNCTRLQIHRLWSITVARNSGDYTWTIHRPLTSSRSPPICTWMLHLPRSLCWLHGHLVSLRVSRILRWRYEHSSPHRLRWRCIHTHLLRKRVRSHRYQVNPCLVHAFWMLVITCTDITVRVKTA